MIVPLTADQAQFVALLNDYRKHHGAGVVVVDASLQSAAVFRAADMANREYFSHTTPGRGSEREVMIQHGYDVNASTAAVILYGEPSSAEALAAWQRSPPHNAVLLDPRYRAVGIGGPADPQWSFANDVFQAWAGCFGSAVTTPVDDVQPPPATRPPYPSRPPKPTLPDEPPPHETKEGRKAQRKAERRADRLIVRFWRRFGGRR